MKVNLGCGEFYANSWTNVDKTKVDGGPQPDIVASATKLPFKNKSVKKLYAGHVLEHISLEDISTALSEIHRVLSDDGVFMVVGPDVDRARERFPDEVDSLVHGAHRWDGDEHHWESTESKMLEILKDNGWTTEPLPISTVNESEWPIVSKVEWQFAIEAKKA